MLATALMFATVISAELPPPPLVDADVPVAAAEPFSPPPLVEAVDRPLSIAPSSEVRAEVKKPVEASRPMFGVALDAAAPDGAGVNLMLRPLQWLELHGGVAHNAITPGFRGGVTLLPADHWFVPTLTLELGTHPPGDANVLLQTLIGNESLRFDALDSVGYDYQNAMLGFTLGSREHFTIYFRGGVTRVVGRTGESGLVANPTPGGSGSTGSGTAATEPLTLFLPALKAGFAIYFF